MAAAVSTKWQKRIDKAVEIIGKEKIPYKDNYSMINRIFPVWEDLIINDANIDQKSCEEFKKLSAEEKVIFIKNNHPQFQIQIFWSQMLLNHFKKGKK